MTTSGTPDYVGTAQKRFDRAVAADDAREAIRALELLGRALLVDAGTTATLGLSDGFAATLTEHKGLVARAAGSLGMIAEMDGEDELLPMLYARSGYQALVDAGVWPGHPVRLAHLEESDEELSETLDEFGLPVDETPEGFPPGHVWWTLDQT